jgi:tetratricopeptide (TPR) repeat protein
VIRRARSFVYLVLCVSAAAAQDAPKEFQAALSDYRAGRFSEAAGKLESILPRYPRNFAVHELLGLVYAAESQPAKAIEQLRKALVLDPKSFDANHNLGELLLRRGDIAGALPLLQQAQKLKPSSYENGYNLSLAYFLTGHTTQSEELAKSLLSAHNTGELHNLLAQIKEKQGSYLAAADEFSTAAHMDPSEQNLFDWGSELLLHRTYGPAVEVFGQALQRYPDSPRCQIGMGMALSALGKYEEAIQALLKAADLNPSDPRCYRFLAHAYELSPNPSDDVVERFRRFAELRPQDGMAQFFYATSLLKGKKPELGSSEFVQVEDLLRKAIALDEKNAQAHFRLGNLYADQRDFDRSFPEYEKTVALDPDLPDVHYRLGQYYVHAGKKELAQKEFAAYEALRAKYLARLDKEGASVQQFITSSKTGKPTP